MYMFNQCCCCYSKPILDVADNKFAESAAVLMLKGPTDLNLESMSKLIKLFC
jgi:hypothetical protein